MVYICPVSGFKNLKPVWKEPCIYYCKIKMWTRIFKIEDKNNKLLMFVDLAQDPSPNTTKRILCYGCI